MIETIDLIIYLCMCFIVMPLGIALNKDLYTKIKNEEHKEKGKIVQSLMKQYSLLQCIAPTLLLVLFGLFYLCHNGYNLISEPYGHYLLNTLRFAYSLNRDYVSFNSLIIAIIRYTFVVKGTNVEAFGVSKLRHLFIACSIGIPIFNNFLYEATQPIESLYTSIFYDKPKDMIDGRKHYQNLTNRVDINDTYEFTTFILVKEFLPSQLRYLLIVMEDIMIFILYSNILEGILYAYTMKAVKR